MADINDYVYAASVVSLRRKVNDIQESFATIDSIKDTIRNSVGNNGVDPYLDQAISNLESDELLISITDELAGNFYKFNKGKIQEKYNAFKTNPATLGGKMVLIGTQMLSAALNNHDSDNKNADQRFPLDQPAPASDRVVTLTHNQSSEFESQSSELIERLEQEKNEIDGDPTLRQIILGQLRAGRELIREGCFKAYILQITLIDALLFLVKRYEKEAIGALAGALAAELIKLIG